MDKDSKTIEKEASKIRTPTSQQFTQSANQLYEEAHSIPDNMTIEQARSRIEGDAQNVKRNAQAMANESGCPEAMPQTQTQ